jgi:hypothetical protein
VGSIIVGVVTAYIVARDNSERDDVGANISLCVLVAIGLRCVAGIVQTVAVWDNIRGYQSSFEKFEPENGLFCFNFLLHGAIAQLGYGVFFFLACLALIIAEGGARGIGASKQGRLARHDVTKAA